nr:MAG TPA: hypothetical protein [Bacteriophage sp.]
MIPTTHSGGTTFLPPIYDRRCFQQFHKLTLRTG